MISEPSRILSRAPFGWRAELASHETSRAKRSGPHDALLERCSYLTRRFYECATSPDGRRAREARDMLPAMRDCYAKLAALALREPSILERVADIDARAAVETILEKLQTNKLEGHDDET